MIFDSDTKAPGRSSGIYLHVKISHRCGRCLTSQPVSARSPAQPRRTPPRRICNRRERLPGREPRHEGDDMHTMTQDLARLLVEERMRVADERQTWHEAARI